jgi:microcystin degradation protein MlrC
VFRFLQAGQCALIEAEGGNITVLLTERQSSNVSRGQFYQAGVHPEEYRIIVAKGVQSPRPAYQPIASHVLMANTPGITSADLTSFQYEKRRVPLYPFETDAELQLRQSPRL